MSKYLKNNDLRQITIYMTVLKSQLIIKKVLGCTKESI